MDVTGIRKREIAIGKLINLAKALEDCGIECNIYNDSDCGVYLESESIRESSSEDGNYKYITINFLADKDDDYEIKSWFDECVNFSSWL